MFLDQSLFFFCFFYAYIFKKTFCVHVKEYIILKLMWMDQNFDFIESLNVCWDIVRQLSIFHVHSDFILLFLEHISETHQNLVSQWFMITHS